jgi:uncharacterized protein
MKVRFLDKNMKNFIGTSTSLIIFLFFVLAVFGFTYNFSTIKTYNLILLILIMLTIIITLFLMTEIAAILYTYRKRHINKRFIAYVRFGLNSFLPFGMVVSGLINISKDDIRNFFIDINNILAQSENRKYQPKDILVLLPHCLQDVNCGYKITNNIENCHRCGKCCIGNILNIALKTGVSAKVVTGGTVARKLVLEKRPKVIVSVACERDLISGIIDVKGIPVIGLTNDRPYGPCYNTSVNVENLKSRIQSILVNCEVT